MQKAYGYSQEVIPGMDYEHARSQFDKSGYIWDQGDYEERVKVEAELMVSLEVLTDLYEGIGEDMQVLQGCTEKNSRDTYSQMVFSALLARSTTFDQVFEIDRQMYDILYTCQVTGQAMDVNRDALRLYCQ